MAALAALPYAIAEFAKLAGLTSIASLGTAKAIDTIRNYAKANPEKSKELISLLNPGIIKDFEVLSAFWKKYQNPFEPYLKKGYNSYLKANGQAMGIESYNAMVALVIAHSEVNNYSIDKL